ncbi:MAG TPA: sigma factor-like helix-turn-helix DNA-binding protein [Polyangia bacterium]|nr:sigma factor-like helix-turn-helix DNA-binding protein [Polyangia bacterium]
MEIQQARRIAREIIDAMASKKREVFILAEFEELTPGEIAVILGVREQTVWSRYAYKSAPQHPPCARSFVFPPRSSADVSPIGVRAPGAHRTMFAFLLRRRGRDARWAISSSST